MNEGDPASPRRSSSRKPPSADALAEDQRVVFGVRPVDETLRAHPRSISVIYLAEGSRSGEVDAVVRAARDRGIAVETRPRAFVAAMAGRVSGAQGASHQGIVAVTGGYAYASLDELYGVARAAGEEPLFLIVDGVTDPHNFGALIRSAEVMGAHGVLAPAHGAAPVTPVVVKASAGATERMKVAQLGNLLPAIDALRKRGLRVWGAAAGQGVPLEEADFRGACAIVVGSEGRGMREAVARRCDGLFQIPQRGKIASLNVSVAGAIALYEAARQRKNPPGVVGR